MKDSSSLTLALAGCATTAVDPEAAREVALQYINSDVGTTGPSNKNRTKDLDVPSAEDRAKALTLSDRGAVGFVAFGAGTVRLERVPARGSCSGVGEGGRRFSGPCRPRATLSRSPAARHARGRI